MISTLHSAAERLVSARPAWLSRHAGRSGRSAAWLAHLTGGQGVGSSNLPAPTGFVFLDFVLSPVGHERRSAREVNAPESGRGPHRSLNGNREARLRLPHCFEDPLSHHVDCRRHVHSQQLDGGVGVGEYAEEFVSKGLPYFVDFGKIQHDDSKLVESNR